MAVAPFTSTSSDFLPRSSYFERFARLSKCPKDTLGGVSQHNPRNQRSFLCVLIIFLLVHSWRHTLTVPSRPPGAAVSKTLKSWSWINLITYLQAFIINERAPATSVDYNASLHPLRFSQGLFLGLFSFLPPNITQCHSP